MCFALCGSKLVAGCCQINKEWCCCRDGDCKRVAIGAGADQVLCMNDCDL